jgi:hypothetical protein
MSTIETGFSERAAERRAVEEDRKKVAAYLVKRCAAAGWNLDHLMIAGLAREILRGGHVDG